jgi:hypothetical protein
MALQATVPDDLKQFSEENQRNSIAPNEGTDAFNRILSYPLPQIIVSGRDLQTAIKQHHSAKNIESNAVTSSSKQVYPRPNLDKAYIAPRKEVEYTIATIWQNLLGIEKVAFMMISLRWEDIPYWLLNSSFEYAKNYKWNCP